MQPRPSSVHTFLNLVAMGIILILGIAWIFATSNLDKSRDNATAIPATPGSLGRETLTPSPLGTAIQDESRPTSTGTGPDAYPGPSAESLPSGSLLITKTLPPPPPTTTPDNIQPLLAGKYYDDTDSNIAYDPYWIALKNPGTANAYHGTIHSSDRIGNEASFRFTGRRFQLGYQRGTNFGTVTVIVDDQPYSFHEQAFDLVWSSPQLPPGDHFVRIIHESGQSINLDYIVIVD